MAKEIIMPKFGFVQEESEILEWLKNEGDPVEKGDPIAMVSTDKISMEVEAPETGILAGIRYPVGAVVPVTKPIAFILQPGEKVPEISHVKTKIEQAKTPPAPSGESVQPAEFKPVRISPVAARMAEDTGLDLSELEGTGPGGQITREDVERHILSEARTTEKVNATPAARRVASEKQIDLQLVRGFGPGGRIQEADVVSAFTREPQSPPDYSGASIAKEIPLIGIRRVIAENMQRSMRDAPHMTLQVNVCMDSAEAMRKEANAGIDDKSKRISATAVLVKAAALSIRRNMIINSQFTHEKILILDGINIGVAVAIEGGLIVPVVGGADKKDIHRISEEVNDLAARARNAQLKPQDLKGGTFTISNLGMMGIDSFTAIINPPQSAILAAGAISRQVIPDDADLPAIRVAKMMALTLSADHRVMDGAQAAGFLADLQEILEHPEPLFE